MRVEGKKLVLTRTEWDQIGKKAGWHGMAKKAQADQQQGDVFVSSVGQSTSASGSITKIVNGTEIDIDWKYTSYPADAHMADKVEFEWPLDLEVDDALREQLEDQWIQEVFAAIDIASGRPPAVGASGTKRVIESKKKGKPVNPWAICTKSVGREDKDKYEECVLAVKEKHPIKKD